MVSRNFRSIKAWQHAYQLTLQIYKASRPFPTEERYGITSQVRLSAASIAANIAEGSSRRSKSDFLRFLEIALGSLREVECFLMLARDLEYLSSEQFDALNAKVQETARTMSGLIASIEADKTLNGPKDSLH
jgi:four helix bundle protein